MALRTISAFVALPLFFAVVYLLPPVCLPIAISAIAVIAVYELLWRSGIMKDLALNLIAYVYAAAIPIWTYLGSPDEFILPALFVLVIAVFVCWLIKHGKLSFENITAAFFAGIVIPLFLSAIVGIVNMENGKAFVLLPFVAAWMTDTGAYFTGVFLGKHKLAPEISPKKTVEGSIGGIIVCAVSFLVYGIIIGIEGKTLIVFTLCALAMSVIAQIGDLSMSLIKRQYGIKDYGVIFPGHGGILDRFDSVLFTAPASLILLRLLEIAI